MLTVNTEGFIRISLLSCSDVTRKLVIHLSMLQLRMVHTARAPLCTSGKRKKSGDEDHSKG